MNVGATFRDFDGLDLGAAGSSGLWGLGALGLGFMTDLH